jgi:O-antigen/teichoic acid export membrane protein
MTGEQESALSRVTRGATALAAASFINILSQLLVVPFALRAWGPERYGEWVSLSALITFLTLTDLGVQVFVVNRMTASHARGRLEEFETDLADALAFQTPVALLLFAAVILIMVGTSPGAWLGLRVISHRDMFLIVVLLAVEPLVGLPMGVAGGVYRATGRLARAGWLDVGKRSATLSLTVLTILAGGGVVGVAAVRAGMTLLTAMIWLRDIRRTNPWLRLRIRPSRAGAGAKLALGGFPFLLLPLADLAATQGTILVLQHVGSGSAVAEFSTHRTVANAAGIAASFLTAAVWPELTRMEASDDNSGLGRAFGSLTRVNVWMIGSTLSVLLPLAPVLYPAWTGKGLRFEPAVLLVLGLRGVVWGAWGAAGTTLAATNRRRWLVIANFGGAATVVFLALLLVPRMGTLGAAIAIASGEALVQAWILPWLVCRLTGATFRQWSWNAGSAVLASVVLPGIAVFAVRAIVGRGTLPDLIGAGAAAITALLGGWLILGNQLRRAVTAGLTGK